MITKRFAIDCQYVFRHLASLEIAKKPAFSIPTEYFTHLGVVVQFAHGYCEGVDLPSRHSYPSFLMEAHVWHSCWQIRVDNRFTTGHCLQLNQAERFRLHY